MVISYVFFLPSRLKQPTVRAPKILSRFPFLDRKSLVSLRFFLKTSFAFHQYLILSSNKWTFEDVIISQKGNDLPILSFQNTEALLPIKHSCLATLYMYIRLWLHLSLPIWIFIHIWIHIVFLKFVFWKTFHTLHTILIYKTDQKKPKKRCDSLKC